MSWFAGFFKLHSRSKLLRLFAVRYAVSAIVAMEILVIPLLLDSKFYSEFEYYRSLTVLLQFSLFGSYTGYTYAYYREGKDEYQSLFCIGLAIAIVVAAASGVWYGSLWLFVACFFSIVALLIDRRLQTIRFFVLSSLFRALCSLLVILLAFLSFSLKLSVPLKPDLLLGWATVGGFIFWMLLCFPLRHQFLSTVKLSLTQLLRNYFELVKRGWLINLSTQFLALYFFADRDFIRTYHPAELAGYSLGFNVCQIVFIGLNTLALVAQADLGEKFSELKHNDLLAQLRKGTLVFCFLFVVGLFAALGYQSIIIGYDGFISTFVTLGLLFGIFYICNTISSVALYLDLSGVMAVLIGVCLCLSYSANLLLFRGTSFPFSWLLLKSGGILALFGLAMSVLIFRSLKRRLVT